MSVPHVDDVEPPAEPPPLPLIAVESWPAPFLVRALEALPADEAVAIGLVMFEACNEERVAELVGTSVRTVRERIRHGLRVLAGEFDAARRTGPPPA